MMTIGKDNITSEFTLKELGLLDIILNEKEVYFKEDLSNKDPHKYIQLLQLRGKVTGLIDLIKTNAKTE